MNRPTTAILGGFHRGGAFVVLTVLVMIAALLVAVPGAGAGEGDARDVYGEPGPGRFTPPRVTRSSPFDIADSALRDALARVAGGEPAGLGVSVSGHRVLVDVRHDLGSSSVRRLLASFGATVYQEVGSEMVEAFVPIARVAELQRQTGIRAVALPPRPHPISAGGASTNGAIPLAAPVVGEEVAKTNADRWHESGHTGTGVKIGIIDFFDSNYWNPAQAAGEVPAPAGVGCWSGGVPCNIWSASPGARHGTAVAEIVHEMAPDAQIYLATVGSPGDQMSAIDYFASQGVQVINQSLAWWYDGAGDGTGLSAVVLAHAVSKGIVWINAAGNFAGGSYWRGPWVDADADGWLDFAPGDNSLGFYCGWSTGLRWSDWSAGQATDYDVYIFDADWKLKATSISDQTGGDPPVENFSLSCAPGEINHLFVSMFHPGDGYASDILEIVLDSGQPMEYWSNPYSAAIPYADTSNPGGLAVGAVDPPTGSLIGSYSSRGSTNDIRVKPDLSAASGVASFTYGTFNGTSASAPTVAGAAALIIEAGLASTPAQVKTYLIGATVDRGSAGPDNDYGAGELDLGDPPNQQPVAVDDAYGATKNAQLSKNAAAGVLFNDTDADGDALTVSASDVVSAEGGTVLVAGDGSFTYDPPVDFTGTDTFGYTVSDGALTDTATVTITVTTPPVGIDDGYDATEDTRLMVPAAAGVLSNDADADGDALTVPESDVVSAEGGTVLVAGDGSFTYDPPVDFSGTDTFGYTVSDAVLTDTATVTITVAAVPDPPVGGDDAYGVTKNTQLSKNAAAGVLFNDIDADGDALTVSESDVVSAGGGTVLVAGDGSFTYDPPVDFTGTDMFGYTVSDGALTDTATVTITVSTPPAPGGGGGVLAAPPQETCPENLPGTGFVDLNGYPAETIDAIACLVAYEISLGTGPTTFAPGLPVTRWQMALFLKRQIEVHGVGLPSSGEQGFTDIVSLPQAIQDAINQLAVLGITKGTTGTSFDPNGVVTRWQMALFLTRVADLVEIPLSGTPQSQFLDIGGYSPETQTAIKQLADAGIAKGTSPTTFDPGADVLRWHMALFLVRVLTAGGVTLS